mgnify:CR=1 FL=1
MPYLRPPLVVRRFANPIAMRLGIGGSERLTVTRRRSRTEQSIPVIPVTVDGTVHLVCPRGETDWVKNLRATPACALGRHGRQRPYVAAEVPLEERGPIIVAYRAKAGRAVKSLFDALPDDRDHPVFRLTPSG